MELTNIIKKKIIEFYIAEYGKEPTGVQLDTACSRVKTEMVNNVVTYFSWKEFIQDSED